MCWGRPKVKNIGFMKKMVFMKHDSQISSEPVTSSDSSSRGLRVAQAVLAVSKDDHARISPHFY